MAINNVMLSFTNIRLLDDNIIVTRFHSGFHASTCGASGGTHYTG